MNHSKYIGDIHLQDLNTVSGLMFKWMLIPLLFLGYDGLFMSYLRAATVCGLGRDLCSSEVPLVNGHLKF